MSKNPESTVHVFRVSQFGDTRYTKTNNKSTVKSESNKEEYVKYLSSLVNDQEKNDYEICANTTKSPTMDKEVQGFQQKHKFNYKAVLDTYYHTDKGDTTLQAAMLDRSQELYLGDEKSFIKFYKEIEEKAANSTTNEPKVHNHLLDLSDNFVEILGNFYKEMASRLLKRIIVGCCHSTMSFLHGA